MASSQQFSTNRLAPTRFVFWSALVFALFFLSFGITFWAVTRASLALCVFTDGPCSTAVATWTLVSVSVFAFIAAYHAARKASQALAVSQNTYNLETEPLLSQNFCTNAQHKLPRVSIFVNDDNKVSIQSPADNRSLDDFGPVEFDFENGGRSALRNVRVTLRLRPDQTASSERLVSLRLGDIIPEKDAHVVVYLLWDAPSRPIVGWNNVALITVSDSDDELEFSSVPDLRIQGKLQKDPHRKKEWNITYADLSEAKTDETAKSQEQ